MSSLDRIAAAIRSAAQQHMYQEEDSWLPDLVQNTPAEEKAMLTSRYAEEYNRYSDGSEQAAASGFRSPVAV